MDLIIAAIIIHILKIIGFLLNLMILFIQAWYFILAFARLSKGQARHRASDDPEAIPLHRRRTRDGRSTRWSPY